MAANRETALQQGTDTAARCVGPLSRSVCIRWCMVPAILLALRTKVPASSAISDASVAMALTLPMAGPWSRTPPI